MHAGENLHGDVARVVAHELLVNFEDAFQLAIQNLAVDVGQVEVDHRLAVDAQVVLVDHLENRAGGDIARHQVAVLGIPLFEEVPALGFRDATSGSRLSPGVFGTQTRPPSPRADSDIRRSLSSPGMEVG